MYVGLCVYVCTVLVKTEGPTSTTPTPENPYGNGGVPPYGVPPSNGYYGMQPSPGYWPPIWPWYLFPYSMGKPYQYGPQPSYGVQKPPAYGQLVSAVSSFLKIIIIHIFVNVTVSIGTAVKNMAGLEDLGYLFIYT